MPYEELETLQKLVKQINERMANEQDNYNALIVQCQDVLAKLEEQEKITNKYGQFFADIYRALEKNAQIDGEINIPNPEATFLYRAIDLIEIQVSQTIDSDLAAKKQELDKLTDSIEARKKELKQIQIDASYAANELQKDRHNLGTPQATRNNPPHAHPHPEEIIANLPGVPSKKSETHSAASISNEKSNVASKPGQPASIGTKPYKGFLIPQHMCEDHLYLCASNGAAPIDITDLVDVRMNHLLRLGGEFAQTYRPQFRLLHPSTGAWSIGESEGVVNFLNGNRLQGEKLLHNEDELTITDKDGKKYNLMFMFK